MDVKRTMVAGQAVGLAELFRFTVGKTVIEGARRYGLQMSAPEGESTGGGRAALQHIALVPSDGAGATIVIGTAHAPTKRAELRTFRHVDAAHRQRFGGSPLEVDRAAFDQLQASLAAFFTDREFQVAFDDGAADAPVADAPAGGGLALRALVAGAAVLVFVGAAVALLRR